MKGSQLIPTALEEDSRAVSIEPIGTSIAPTMQVSLAKRIIQPGTNRVICLAAQTTVPMEDDDIASVSDLALRLSDGTNVKVSMSFFNDVALGTNLGANFTGESSRRVYDPDWYDNHREREKSESSSRLWLLFAAFCAVTVGSFCYFIPGGIEKLATEIVAKMPPLKLPQPIASPLKPALPSAGANAIRSASQPKQKTKSANAFKTAKTQSTKSSRKFSKGQVSTTRVSQSSSSGSRSMLIPPPPPTAFEIPISQMAMYNLPPYAMPSPPATLAKTNSLKPKVKQLNLEIPKQTDQNLSGSINSGQLQTPMKSKLSPQMQALFPEPARAYSHARSTPQTHASENQSGTTSSATSPAAPMPGGGSQPIEQPQLERIELY